MNQNTAFFWRNFTKTEKNRNELKYFMIWNEENRIRKRRPPTPVSDSACCGPPCPQSSLWRGSVFVHLLDYWSSSGCLFACSPAGIRERERKVDRKRWGNSTEYCTDKCKCACMRAFQIIVVIYNNLFVYYLIITKSYKVWVHFCINYAFTYRYVYTNIQLQQKYNSSKLWF